MPVETSAAEHAQLVRALATELAAMHGKVDIVETHISSVVLAGKHAIKLKKPVDFGFLDYSTLAKRRRSCQQELVLNRRYAPSLYEAVVPITGERARPVLGGSGQPLDYALLMRRFPSQAELPGALERGALTPALIDGLAATLARFHGAAPALTARSRYGAPAGILRDCRDNIARLSASAPEHRATLEAIADWTLTAAHRLESQFQSRRRGGRIRECHGDLHLGNMVLVDGAILPFDCIEFDRALRCIDVMSDLAFVVMDLDRLGAAPLASRLLNEYLTITGDYDGARVLRFYLVYRAMVRAKVAALRAGQISASPAAFVGNRVVDTNISLAARYCSRSRPVLILMHGFSGSGKTRLARELVTLLGAVQIRTDVERKRLAGVPAEARSGSGIGNGLYSRSRSQDTYARLRDAAESCLSGGFSVIVDGAFLLRADRQPFRDLARRLDVQPILVSLEARAEQLRERIAARQALGQDASEADASVLEWQMANAEPLADSERSIALRIDATANVSIGELHDALMQRVSAPLPDPR